MENKQLKTLQKEYEEILFRHISLANKEMSRLMLRCSEELQAKHLEIINKAEGKQNETI